MHVSAVSAVETAIKHRIGKLPGGDELVTRFKEFMDAYDFVATAVTVEHALRAGSYPGPHRDPFDRLLAAQAEMEGLVLITRDPAFAAFPCETRW